MENDVTYPTPTAARRWLVITGCIAALMLLWQFLPAIEAWFSPHETLGAMSPVKYRQHLGITT